MVLLPWLKSFPLPGSVILSAQLPSPVCKSYGSFASGLYRYGVCFASHEIDLFANELSTRQLEKKTSRKILEIKVFSKNKKICQKQKKWDSNSGILTFHGIFAI